MEKVEFFENGNISYEGNFENGKYHGFGKKYTVQGHLMYQGNFEEGLPNGEGTLFTRSTIVEGTFAEGKLNGKVKITDNTTHAVTYREYVNGVSVA